MKKNIASQFKKNGYHIEKKLFSKLDIKKLESEFDKIIFQLENSGENINAHWRSDLTKNIDSPKSKIIHTHNVQSYSSIMMKMVQNKKLLNLAESFIGKDIILHHTKLFLKPPHIGSAFPLHQDWSYFPTKKNTMIAAVIHLSDSEEKMGSLRVIPKSHKFGKIESSDGHTKNKKIHDEYDLKSAHPIRAKKGDVLFFHCCTIHGSLSNTSMKNRKTILIQLYSGKDYIIDNNNHTNVQLVLKGWNHHARRNNVENIFS